jgi:hypothetical protein
MGEFMPSPEDMGPNEAYNKAEKDLKPEAQDVQVVADALMVELKQGATDYAEKKVGPASKVSAETWGVAYNKGMLRMITQNWLKVRGDYLVGEELLMKCFPNDIYVKTAVNLLSNGINPETI